MRNRTKRSDDAVWVEREDLIIVRAEQPPGNSNLSSAIHRPLAIGELAGPRAALDAMPEAAANPALSEYQPYWATRADLLARTGSLGEARHAYEIATGLERDPAVRQFLEGRQSALAS